jgi:putative ABC transport system permease protein
MNDLRYAVRMLIRAPGFAATAILTLALGIGATTAIFSVVKAVVLEPLPYRDPARLVVTRLSFPDYRDVQRNSQSFEQMAVWATNLYTIDAGSEDRQILAAQVSSELFSMLGIAPAAGRLFTAEDDRQASVILGHGLWQSLYGGDPSAVGRVIDLSGAPYTIVGVTPAGFRFPSAEFELWTSAGMLLTQAKPQIENRALRIFTAIGRLKPGVTIEQASTELRAISADLARTHPATNDGIVLQVSSLTDRIVGNVRTPLLVLVATVGLILLIACANVANLMLARTTARDREIAIRSALGAARRRLFGQLAVESLVLAIAGGVSGLLLAMWAIDLVPTMLASRLPRAEAVRIDGAVLLVTLAVTLLTSVIFGVAPALQAQGSVAALREAGRGVAGSARHRTLRSAIVVVEVGLAIVVVIGAGLLVRSFVTLTTRDPGFDPDHVLSFNLQLGKLPDPPARGRAAATVMERLSSLPGVEAAGGATGLPTVTPQRGTRFEVEARKLTAGEDGALFMAATPGVFDALRTPVLSGRAFQPTDTAGGQPVVLINRTLANTVFPGTDPVGRRIRVVNPEYANDWRTIVGVVGDVQYRRLDPDMQPTIYVPFSQTPFMWAYVMVRTTGDPSALTRSIKSIVQSVDPNLITAPARPMTEIVSGTVAEPRLSMLLVAGFALLALILASVGIYGVIAYSVSQRTHELGLRMALGAARVGVLAMIVREGVLMAAIGIVTGLGAAALATRLMQDLLVGITPRDPLTFAGGAVLLLLIAAAASYLPARRATRVDPMVALRAE